MTADFFFFQNQQALSPGFSELTYRGHNKMAAILHVIFSNAFALMKISEFRITFH